MQWCPCGIGEERYCPTLILLDSGDLTDHGGFEFEIAKKVLDNPDPPDTLPVLDGCREGLLAGLKRYKQRDDRGVRTNRVNLQDE